MRLTMPIWDGVGVPGVIGFCFLLTLLIFAFDQLTERQTKFYRALYNAGRHCVATTLWRKGMKIQLAFRYR